MTSSVHHSNTFQELLESIQGMPVAVLGHVRPDGDCIGSQVALTRVLLSLGYNALAVNWHNVPENMTSFVGDTPFITGANFDPRGYAVICVDCASRDRLGVEFHPRFTSFAGCIDHHVSNQGFARFDIIETSASSTTQILTQLFLSLALPIDAITAQALYLGISTDTGQFRHGADTPALFETVSRLVRLGAKPSSVARSLYQNTPYRRVSLLKLFLASLEREMDGRICTGFITRADFESTGANREDTEGFVEFTREIQGVTLGAYLEELSPASGKASLRCADSFYRLDLLAARYGGGGHPCAAGFTFHEPMRNFYPQFIQAARKHLLEHTPSA